MGPKGLIAARVLLDRRREGDVACSKDRLLRRVLAPEYAIARAVASHGAPRCGDGAIKSGFRRNDIRIGYNLEAWNTRLDIGVNNVGDKQPPLLYANNTLNANTDPSDFDLMGRYYWGRITVKF